MSPADNDEDPTEISGREGLGADAVVGASTFSSFLFFPNEISSFALCEAPPPSDEAFSVWNIF